MGVDVDFINEKQLKHWSFSFQTINKKINEIDTTSDDLLLSVTSCRHYDDNDDYIQAIAFIFNNYHNKIYAEFDIFIPIEVKKNLRKNPKTFPIIGQPTQSLVITNRLFSFAVIIANLS